MPQPIVRLEYAPRWFQRRFHDDPARFKALVWHRRSGKTVAMVNHCIRGVLKAKGRDPQVAYIAPTYRMAKRIAWAYVKRYTAPIMGMKYSIADLTAIFPNGGKLMLLGAEHVDDLRGLYLDGAVLDEYGLMPPNAWEEVVLPTLLDRDGWGIVAGTPKGADPLKQAYTDALSDSHPDWSGLMFKASETGAFSPETLELAKRNMSAAAYSQEFECSFEAVIVGAYYGEEIGLAVEQGRVCDIGCDGALGVTVAVDLGMRDAFAVWFLQEHPSGGQIRAIDYREFTGKGLPAIKSEIDALGYRITRWCAPHDIAVRELGTGRSRLEIGRELGMMFQASPQLSLQDGIEATRSILPLMWFDRKRCAKGLDALRQYRAEYEPEKGVWSKLPVHDWTSHGADALRTFATARGSPGQVSNWRESIRAVTGRG